MEGGDQLVYRFQPTQTTNMNRDTWTYRPTKSNSLRHTHTGTEVPTDIRTSRQTHTQTTQKYS